MLIAVAVGLGLVLVFVLWRRVPLVPALAALACLGMLAGAGALLVQDDRGLADWVVTLGGLAFLTPLHCRFAFRPPGGSA